MGLQSSNKSMFEITVIRWALIAGRIPGRTAEDIEKYWNSRYSTSEWILGNFFWWFSLQKQGFIGELEEDYRWLGIWKISSFSSIPVRREDLPFMLLLCLIFQVSLFVYLTSWFHVGEKMVNQARVYKIFPLLSVCFHGNGSSFEFVFLLHHTSTCWSFYTMWLISLDFFNGNILQISSFSTLLGSFFFVSPTCKESWIGADAVAIAHGIFSRSLFFPQKQTKNREPAFILSSLKLESDAGERDCTW